MDNTPFLGLTRLDPEDSLSEDNSSFQAVNPTIIDRAIRRAIQHEHTGAPGLDDPPTAPTLVADPTQGVIPADTSILVGYTLVDEFGGETLVSPTAVVTTDAPLDPPDDVPTLTLETTAGTLTVGDYSYAVAYIDGTGGETPVGPMATVTREPGAANAQIVVSGLTAIVAANPGATGWRLYRSKDGGQFYFLAEGATDDLTDDGTLCVDCTGTPLDDTQNTTQSVNALKVTVPSSAEALLATAIRIYASTGDTFATPSLLEEILPGDLAIERTYLTLDLAAGEPPDTNQSFDQPAPVNGLQERATVVASADAVAAAGDFDGSVMMAPSYSLLRVQLPGGEGHIRLFTSEALRDAADGTDDLGVILDADLALATDTDQWFAPAILGYTQDGTAEVFFTITNNSAAPRDMDVTFTFVPLERAA